MIRRPSASRALAFRIPSARPRAALVCAILYGALAALASPALTGAAQAADLSAAEVEALREARAGGMLKLAIHTAPRDLPDLPYLTEDGAEKRLADLAGQVTVLNLWATWCAPCRHEMPSLDALAAEAERLGIRVVALNIERKGRIKARRFFDQLGVTHLEIAVDESNAIPARLGLIGYPVTLVLDPQGREIARMQGDADWHSPEALALLERFAAASRD